MPRSPPGARGGFTCHQGAVKAPGGGGPWASGPWNWPQTRLASKGTPATEITAKPRSPQRHVGHIFSMTKTAPNSGLFEGGKSPLPLPPTTTPAPTSIATHPQLPPPPRLIWVQPVVPGTTQVVPSTGPQGPIGPYRTLQDPIGPMTLIERFQNFGQSKATRLFLAN